jgi:transposase
MENLVERIGTLEEEIEALRQQKAQLETKYTELELKLKWFEEQQRLYLAKMYGKSSEKLDNGQLPLFNEAESEAKPEAPEPTVEEITYKRRKKQGHREEMLKDLPVETVEYHLPETEQTCECGGNLHIMSKEVRKELKIVPAQVSVVEHIQYVYSCRDCEKNNTNTHVKTAKMPKPAIPGSIASSSAIAYVMSEKFVKGIPLYRQEQEWERMGIEISRQTMANWLVNSSDRWLKLIYERMKEHLVQKDILHADETTLQVLKEPGRNADSTSYMWLYRTGRGEDPIILYDYQTTRAAKHPIKFLKDFKGYLHTDGYEGYSLVPEVRLVGCWAHARRYFVDALKAMPDRKDNTPTATDEGINFCNKLFEIERELQDITPEERYEGRLKNSRPVLDDFKAWLQYQRPRILPKSPLGAAVKYCQNQWDKLTAFLLDGRLELDNNRSERSIKPFVIGRKNWLFSNTPKGASSSAVIYSIIETAKENGLNPFEYLKYLFDNLPNINLKDINALDEFMPWSEALPQNCRVKVGTV